MARRIISYTTITPTAYIDTTSMTTTTFVTILQGGSSTQQVKIHEISISGQAASTSAPTFMLLSRDSTVAASTVTFPADLGTDAALDTATALLAAPALIGNIPTSTLPQRSSTLHLMNCSLNAFGGVYFWRANKWDECVDIVGNTASLGEVSLSAYAGGSPGVDRRALGLRAALISMT